MSRVPLLFPSPRRNPQQKAHCFSRTIAPPKLGEGGGVGRCRAWNLSRAKGPGRWQARSVEAYGPALPVVGAQSHIQLLTQCIIITTNSPLKEIIIKMILADSRGNGDRKVLIPYCPLMGTEDGQWAAARALTPQLDGLLQSGVKGGLPEAYYSPMLQPFLSPISRTPTYGTPKPSENPVLCSWNNVHVLQIPRT